jgi:hypothetical protein
MIWKSFSDHLRPASLKIGAVQRKKDMRQAPSAPSVTSGASTPMPAASVGYFFSQRSK